MNGKIRGYYSRLEGEGGGERGEEYILGFWPSASHSGDFVGVLFFRSRRAW